MIHVSFCFLLPHPTSEDLEEAHRHHHHPILNNTANPVRLARLSSCVPTGFWLRRRGLNLDLPDPHPTPSSQLVFLKEATG